MAEMLGVSLRTEKKAVGIQDWLPRQLKEEPGLLEEELGRLQEQFSVPELERGEL